MSVSRLTEPAVSKTCQIGDNEFFVRKQNLADVEARVIVTCKKNKKTWDPIEMF